MKYSCLLHFVFFLILRVWSCVSTILACGLGYLATFEECQILLMVSELHCYLTLLFGGVCFSQGIKDPRSEELKILTMKLSKKPKRLER